MCSVSAWVSRLAVMAGVSSLATLSAAMVSASWLHAREPVSLPGGGQAVSAVTFRVGLWRVCPAVKRVITYPGTLLPSPGCQLIKYSGWREIREADLGIFWSTLEFTPTFVTKMRYATPLVVLALSLLMLATLFALLGHCHSDLNTLIACGLYTIGGLTLASGLVVYVSVLSDVTAERSRHSQLEYRYGWAFQSAGASFVLSEVAALVSITAYLHRFPSVEEMVRAMVPGADRKLKHYQDRSKSGSRETVDPELGSLPTPPDICTSKSKFVSDPRDSTPSRRPSNKPQLQLDLPINKINHHSVPPSHTLVLPEQEPFRYKTIIHQGLLGVADGTSSSGSSTSGTYSSHSLPRGRRPQLHAPGCQRSRSPSGGSLGYCR